MNKTQEETERLQAREAEHLKAMSNALAILNAITGGADPMHVYYEIGRAAMTLKLALPRKVA